MKKRKLKEHTSTMFTVGDLIVLLEQYDKKLPVVRLGHYGEVNDMCSFYFSKKKGTISLNDGKNKTIDVLDIYAPDIGPEPD